MAAQSPTKQTISTRCRRLRQLIDVYFQALEWVIHHDNGWLLGKVENRFCLNRQDLTALGINTVADINDDPNWTQSVENIIWDKKSVDETGMLYRSDLQSKADPGGLEPLPDNAVVTKIYFNPNQNQIPIWEILVTMKGAFCRIEADIQITGTQWSEPPSFQYCECAQDLLDYVKDKNQQPDEILKNLETERKKYKQLANTVRRRSAQPSDETQNQAGTGQDDTKQNNGDNGEALISKKGTTCTFTYQNQQAIVDSKLKGLELIEFLLTHPNKEYTPLELLQETGQRGKGEPATEQVYSPKDIQTLKNAIDGLKLEAEEEQDIEKKEKLEQDIKDAESILHKARNHKGQSRSFSDRHRKSVSRNIETVLKKIAVEHTPLYNHFISYLKTGEICSYRPDNNIFWVLS